MDAPTVPNRMVRVRVISGNQAEAKVFDLAIGQEVQFKDRDGWVTGRVQILGAYDQRGQWLVFVETPATLPAPTDQSR